MFKNFKVLDCFLEELIVDEVTCGRSEEIFVME